MTIVGASAAMAAALAGLGLVTGAGPARASAVADLDGSWAVARAAVNGAVRADSRVLNSTWTFRGTELFVLNTRRGTAMVLQSEAPGTGRVELRRFAERVLDAL